MKLNEEKLIEKIESLSEVLTGMDYQKALILLDAFRMSTFQQMRKSGVPLNAIEHIINHSGKNMIEMLKNISNTTERYI